MSGLTLDDILRTVETYFANSTTVNISHMYTHANDSTLGPNQARVHINTDLILNITEATPVGAHGHLMHAARMDMHMAGPSIVHVQNHMLMTADDVLRFLQHNVPMLARMLAGAHMYSTHSAPVFPGVAHPSDFVHGGPPAWNKHAYGETEEAQHRR